MARPLAAPYNAQHSRTRRWPPSRPAARRHREAHTPFRRAPAGVAAPHRHPPPPGSLHGDVRAVRGDQSAHGASWAREQTEVLRHHDAARPRASGTSGANSRASTTSSLSSGGIGHCSPVPSVPTQVVVHGAVRKPEGSSDLALAQALVVREADGLEHLSHGKSLCWHCLAPAGMPRRSSAGGERPHLTSRPDRLRPKQVIGLVRNG